MTTPQGAEGVLFLFESATLVLWAEEVAGEGGIGVEVVPAPPGAKGPCGLALRAFPADRIRLESLLREEGIDFRVHG